MNKVSVCWNGGLLSGDIILPGSKSLSNRILMLQHLSGQPLKMDGLSEADDTHVLLKVLEQLEGGGNQFNVGDAGTAFRFFTALLAFTEGHQELYGSERMHERPIGPLVDALNRLGADIRYLVKEGYPPLVFSSPRRIPENAKLSLDAGTSSQFISAILMAATQWRGGLELELAGNTVSSSYIDMTLAVLKQYGVACNRKDNSIKISSGITQKQNLPVVEADWSGASYFYALLAASEGGELFLNNLWLNSVQGDKVVSDIYKNWGIESEFNEKGVRIFKKNKYSATKFDYDFTNSPDLVQTLAVSCALTGVSGTFSGLQTLYIKETNRVQALDNELQKIGFQFEKIDHTTNQLISLQEVLPQEQKLQFQTYRDHRMAMAFSPVAMKFGNISIENPEVVGKSFPGFWQQLNNIGISTIFMSDL